MAKAEKKSVDKLSKNRIAILQALKGGKALTYNGVREATGIQKGLTRLMAKETEKNTYPDSLESLGYIKCEEGKETESGGTGPYEFSITASGRTALSQALAAPKVEPKVKPVKAAAKAKPAKDKKKKTKRVKKQIETV